MDKGFIFNGRSSIDFNIYYKSVDRSILPPLKRKEVSIPERDGVYDFGSRYYANRKLEVECFVKADSLIELRRNLRAISEWLSVEGKLTFPDEPDRYYIGRIYESVSMGLISTHGTTTIVFECEPYAYSEDVSIEVNGITTTSEIIIINRGVTGIKPLIVIGGAATSLTIATDTDSITISSIAAKTYLDLERSLCYTIDSGTGQKVNKLNDVTGNLTEFEIAPGTNVLDVSGTAYDIDIEIAIREKYL